MRAETRTPNLPNSVEAEQALLGALLIDSNAWFAIAGRVEASDFYRRDHRIIFDAIEALQAERKATDAVTVGDYLDRRDTLTKAGGVAYLAALARDTPSAANIESYLAAVRERSVLRQLQRLAEHIASSVRDRSAVDVAADALQQLQRLATRTRNGDGLVDSRRLVSELLDDLDRRSGGPTGLTIGLPDLDALTCGLEPGDLAVIAARPGVGKTALLVSIAAHVGTRVATAIFSAEMPRMQLMRRALALEANLPQGLLRRADTMTGEHWRAITAVSGDLAQKRLWVDDTPNPTLAHVRSEAIALNTRQRLGLVLVDYIQLVRNPGANRYEQLRDVAYGLKALAKELALPVIVLAQLNRGVEARDCKRPQLSDLRDSGAIEEAADIVGLLYSEAYYDTNFLMPQVLECQIAKNRNGERGVCLWRFEGEYSRVTPLAPDTVAQYRQLLSQARQAFVDNEL